MVPHMVLRASRFLKILRSQSRYLSFRELIALVQQVLFKVDNIVIYKKDLYTDIADLPSPGVAGAFCKGDLQELEATWSRMNHPPWEFMCSVYDNVTDCFVFKTTDGQIAHISWIYYKADPNRIIDLRENEAEIKYSLTLPEYRGQGLYSSALAHIQHFLMTKGYGRVYICSYLHNLPSIAGITKAGFEYVTGLKFIRILGLRCKRRYQGTPITSTRQRGLRRALPIAK